MGRLLVLWGISGWGAKEAGPEEKLSSLGRELEHQ